MSSVRVLVGTRKGAFILTSDGKREKWDVSGPHFAGWEIYHLKGSPVDPNRIYASQSSGWFGQLIQRSDDGGKTWAAGRQQVRLRRRARHAPVVRRHAASVGVQARLAFRAVADRPGHGLRRRGRRRAVPLRPTAGRPGRSCRACAATAPGPHGSPAPAACACTRSCSIPSNPDRMFIAISAAGAFRTDDGGQTWKPINRGLRFAIHSRSRRPRSATACTASPCTPRGPDVLFMQKHWDVMRSDDAGDTWHEVSGNLPTDFGFVDRRARARAGDDLRRADQERLGALSAGGQAARLPQPHAAATNGSR